MERLRTILIDDESSSLENLQHKLMEFCPGIDVVTTTQRPEEAILLIRQMRPDLIFLDIEMPRMDGFKMLEQLPSIDFEVVFVTAYDHYAMDALKISAFDYLVKPVIIQELQGTVNRLHTKTIGESAGKFNVLRQSLSDSKSQDQTISIPLSEGIEFMQIKNIIRIESSSNYSKLILTTGRPVIVTKLLKEFEEMLSAYGFYRVHNSHLINLSLMKKYLRGEGGQIIMQNGDVIDVSRRKKEEFLKLIGHKGA